MFGNSMEFRTRSGAVLTINPFSQSSIDVAKEVAPGEGIGPFVASALMDAIAAGYVTHVSRLPPEYRHLGKSAHLPD